jgi:PPK2 family polyphosphate:nucleotide phosphotransferase
MPDVSKTLDQFLISPGEKFKLKDHDPGWEGDKKIPKEKRKAFAQELLAGDVEELAEAQELLYAADTWSVLLIFQAMDAAGKDGTIRHVMSGVNPQGCQVYSFKHPSHEELDHNFLWRCMKALPERGRIGIFNRSYYEEVLIVKVHPELVGYQRLPDGKVNKDFWQARYDDINSFERHLTRNGTAILKFFLNVSKDEQRQRFLDRLNEPKKHWKFSASDVKERGYWDDYMEAYEDMLRATSTAWAPWYVVPADYKWVTRAVVAQIVSQKIKSLDLQYPEVTKEQKAGIEAARKELEGE